VEARLPNTKILVRPETLPSHPHPVEGFARREFLPHCCGPNYPEETWIIPELNRRKEGLPRLYPAKSRLHDDLPQFRADHQGLLTPCRMHDEKGFRNPANDPTKKTRWFQREIRTDLNLPETRKHRPSIRRARSLVKPG